MKYTLILSVLLMGFLFSECGTRKKDKITYNIPATYTKEQRKTLLATLNKGKAIYKANCAECHGIFSEGKPTVPNFTNKQLDNYSARFITRDRRNHMAAIKMSPEQLNEVISFLRFKSTKTQDSTSTVQLSH